MSVLSITAPAAASFSAAYTSAGDGAANLVSWDPKEVYVAGAAGAANVGLDLGVATSIDTVLVGFTNLTNEASAQLYYGAAANSLAGVAAPAPTTTNDVRRHVLFSLPAPVTTRYLRIAITPNSASPVTVGRLLAGKALRPSKGHEYGGGRPVIDTGGKQRLLSGGFGLLDGVRKGGWQWTLGDLTDDEREQLYAILRAVGETRPALVVEDPEVSDGLQERIHYGLFDRIEPYARIDANLNRWGLRIEDWV